MGKHSIQNTYIISCFAIDLVKLRWSGKDRLMALAAFQRLGFVCATPKIDGHCSLQLKRLGVNRPVLVKTNEDSNTLSTRHEKDRKDFDGGDML